MSLKTKDGENIQDFVTYSVNDDCCPIPLFHGTRQYALQVTDKDRECFYNACDKVISFAKKLAFGNVIDDDLLFEYQRTKNSFFLNTVVYMYKTSYFEYGDFYLTTSYANAVSFSNNSGGEFGEWAYNQCIGFKDFNIALDKETEAAAEVVMEEYEKYRNSERLVLVYCNVNFKDLVTQGGTPLLVKNEDGKIDRCMDMDDFYECEDTDNFRCQYSFRLTVPEAYCAMVVREKAIREGFSVFTNITDIEGYLKRKRINI